MTGFYSALPFAFVIAGQIFFAWLGDKTGRRALVCGATLFMTGVFCYLAAIAPDADLAAWAIAISAGFWGGATPTIFAISMQIIPREIAATGFGLLAGFSNIVGSTAPYIMDGTQAESPAHLINPTSNLFRVQWLFTFIHLARVRCAMRTMAGLDH